MEERAPLEGLEPAALLGLERGFESQDVLEHVLEAAARVDGEAARGDRVGRAQGVDALLDLRGQLGQEPVVAGGLDHAWQVFSIDAGFIQLPGQIVGFFAQGRIFIDQGQN